MRKHSLSAQSMALMEMRDRGAIEAFTKHMRLKDSEREYFDDALLEAARSLRLFADHEDAIRELIVERRRAK